MNTCFFYFKIFILLVGTTGVSCTTDIEKEEAEELKIIEEYHKQGDTIARHKVEIQFFREIMAGVIKENTKNISDYHTRQHVAGIETDTFVNITLLLLGVKNASMKQRIDSYEYEETENWHSFRDQYNRDMNKISSGIIRITSDSLNR